MKKSLVKCNALISIEIVLSLTHEANLFTATTFGLINTVKTQSHTYVDYTSFNKLTPQISNQNILSE